MNCSIGKVPSSVTTKHLLRLNAAAEKKQEFKTTTETEPRYNVKVRVKKTFKVALFLKKVICNILEKNFNNWCNTLSTAFLHNAKHVELFFREAFFQTKRIRIAAT